jgi:hypothetical protein
MALGMMLHCGASEITREAVKNFAVPDAVTTQRTGKIKGESVWQPVEHEFLLRYTEKALENQGFKVTDSQFGATAMGTRFFGLLQVENKDLDGNGNDRGYSRLVGLRNSFDKSMSAGLAIGAKVFVCDNLSFAGDVTANHRHTKNIYEKLPGMITTAVSKMSDAFRFQDTRIAAYKETSFDKFGLGDQLIQLIRSGSVPPGKAVAIHDEYLKPSADHKMDSKVWNLFNAVTEVLKTVPTAEMCTRTQKLHTELDKVCGVKWVDITARDMYEKELREDVVEV